MKIFTIEFKMKKKYLNYLVAIFLVLILSFFLIFAFKPDLRRSALTKIIGGYNLYQLASLQYNLKGRYDLLGAKQKLLNYINFSNKYANGKSKLLTGIYDATKLVESKASTKEDYLILEDVFYELLKIDPTIYEAQVWYAKSKFYNNEIELSYKHLDEAIRISSAQDSAYRLALKISSNNEKLFNYYCKAYNSSAFGGSTHRYKGGFFGGNIINKIAVEFVNKNEINLVDDEIYTYSGLVLNELVEYDFVPSKPVSFDNLNIYLSFLSGIKIEINEIVIEDNKSKHIKKPKQLLISSKSSFISNDENGNLSLLILKEGDEVINFKFDEHQEKVQKVTFKFRISKLDLVNRKNCVLYE